MELQAAYSSLIVFALGDVWFALPTAIVDEVSENRKIHHLPHSQGKPLFGIANIHGSLLPSVSLERLLALTPAESYHHPLYLSHRSLVVHDQEGSWMIPVTQVLGIFPVRPLELTPPSQDYQGYVNAMIKLEEKLVACIDQERLFTALRRNTP